jgi:hypothetical protein
VTIRHDIAVLADNVEKLGTAGYSPITAIRSTRDGATVNAIKNDKPVRLVIVDSGQINEKP